MADEKKKSCYDNRVQAYLHPALREKFDEYVSLRQVSESEVVASAVKMFLEKENSNSSAGKRPPQK